MKAWFQKLKSVTQPQKQGAEVGCPSPKRTKGNKEARCLVTKFQGLRVLSRNIVANSKIMFTKEKKTMKRPRNRKHTKVGLQKVQLERIVRIRSNHTPWVRFHDRKHCKNTYSNTTLWYSNTGPRRNEMPKDRMAGLIRGPLPPHSPLSAPGSRQPSAERANPPRTQHAGKEGTRAPAT